MKPKDIHMGFGAETEIQKQLRTDYCSGKDVENVRKEAAKFISALVSKITERCPLRSVILRTAIAFDPFEMWSKSAEILRSKVKILIQKLVSLKVLSSAVGDNTLIQYCDMLEHNLKVSRNTFVAFKREDCRLDYLFSKILNVDKKYPDISLVIKFILKSWARKRRKGI